MISSLENMRGKTLLMALNSTLMSFSYTRYFSNYLQCFGILIGAAWCRGTVISAGAASSTFLTQKIIIFEHVGN